MNNGSIKEFLKTTSDDVLGSNSRSIAFLGQFPGGDQKRFRMIGCSRTGGSEDGAEFEFDFGTLLVIINKEVISPGTPSFFVDGNPGFSIDICGDEINPLWLAGVFLYGDTGSSNGFFGVLGMDISPDKDTILQKLDRYSRWGGIALHAFSLSENNEHLNDTLCKAEINALFGSWYLDFQKMEFFQISEGTLRLLNQSKEIRMPVGVGALISRVHPDDQDLVKRILEMFKLNQLPAPFPSIRIRVGNQWKCFEIWGDIILNPDKHPVGFHGNFRDVTESRYFKDVFQESENERELILNSFEEGGVIIDSNFSILWMSMVFQNLMNFLNQERAGRSLLKYFPESKRMEIGEKYLGILFRDSVKVSWEYSNNGRSYFFTGHPVKDDSSETNRAIIVVKDITRKRLLENHWIQARSEEAVGRLARAITHELNNQLAVILGTAEALAENPEKEFNSGLNDISRAVEISQLFLQKMGNYSRIDPSGFTLLNLNKQIRDLAAFIEEWCNDSIRLSVNLPESSSFHIRGDRGFIQNLLLNLGYNRVVSLTDGCEISLSLNLVESGIDIPEGKGLEDGTFAVITLEDNSHPLSQGEMSRFFLSSSGFFDDMIEPGFSDILDNLEFHGGGVSLKNGEKQGNVFSIYFPVIEERQVLKKGESVLSGTENTNLILVVEDESIVRKILEMQIRSFGYQVATAAIPAEGVAFFEENWRAIDLVLLDMNMPEMDGLAVFRKMKDIDPQVNVLVLSGYSQHGKIEAALKEGVLDFMTKPIRKAHLSEKISEVLEKHVKKSTANSNSKGFDSMPVFDRDFFQNQFSSTPGLEEKVVESFRVTAPALIGSLEEVVGGDDFDEIARRAHKCYGPLVSLGGTRAGALVKALEMQASECNGKGMSELMAEFKDAFQEMLAALKQGSEG